MIVSDEGVLVLKNDDKKKGESNNSLKWIIGVDWG